MDLPPLAGALSDAWLFALEALPSVAGLALEAVKWGTVAIFGSGLLMGGIVVAAAAVSVVQALAKAAYGKIMGRKESRRERGNSEQNRLLTNNAACETAGNGNATRQTAAAGGSESNTSFFLRISRAQFARRVFHLGKKPQTAAPLKIMQG